jgi:hypothetical protein
VAETETSGKSFGSKVWDFAKSTAKNAATDIGAEMGRAVADVGSTYQACLYNGWHSQSASIESPEQISEQMVKDEQNKKLEVEKDQPRIGLERE